MITNKLNYNFVDRHEVFGRMAGVLLVLALGAVLFLFWGLPYIGNL